MEKAKVWRKEPDNAIIVTAKDPIEKFCYTALLKFEKDHEELLIKSVEKNRHVAEYLIKLLQSFCYVKNRYEENHPSLMEKIYVAVVRMRPQIP